MFVAEGDRIKRLFVIRNPDKLAYPMADRHVIRAISKQPVDSDAPHDKILKSSSAARAATHGSSR
jgi:hypothetical protein